MPKTQVLTNADILKSQGLVEMFDPTVSAYRQVKIEDAKKMIENFEHVKKQLAAIKEAAGEDVSEDEEDNGTEE